MVGKDGAIVQLNLRYSLASGAFRGGLQILKKESIFVLTPCIHLKLKFEQKFLNQHHS